MTSEWIWFHGGFSHTCFIAADLKMTRMLRCKGATMLLVEYAHGANAFFFVVARSLYRTPHMLSCDVVGKELVFLDVLG